MSTPWAKAEGSSVARREKGFLLLIFIVKYFSLALTHTQAVPRELSLGKDKGKGSVRSGLVLSSSSSACSGCAANSFICRQSFYCINYPVSHWVMDSNLALPVVRRV